jgi:hypothetical protein
MKRRVITSCCGLALFLGFATAVWASTGIPDPEVSYAVTAATQQVMCVNCPHGDGDPLSACRAQDASIMDATITLYLRTFLDEPIIGYPAADLWLEGATGSITTCFWGTIADADTDINGETTFSQALFAGGNSLGVDVFVSGMPLMHPPLDIIMVSPDIDGNGNVNLSDVIFFTPYYYGDYSSHVDFHWDGVLNLSDVIVLAAHIAHDCP